MKDNGSFTQKNVVRKCTDKNKTYQILKPGGKLITVCFGRQTTGYGTGRELEENTFKNIPKGALSDRGITHFFGKDELRETLQTTGFDEMEIKYSIYT